MKTKTFTDIVELKAGELFSEIKNSPQYAGYITKGVPMSIAVYLKNKMMTEKTTEATLDVCKLFQFTLRANKKGDSVALIPEFNVLSDGKEYIDSDDVDFSIKTIEDLALDLGKNKEYIEIARNALAAKIYNEDGEWEEVDTKTVEKGLAFDDEADISTAICSFFVSLIEILANNKDASDSIDYDVDYLGKFTVKPGKDGYTTTLTFDKEFKSNCKSDKLSEMLALSDI